MRPVAYRLVVLLAPSLFTTMGTDWSYEGFTAGNFIGPVLTNHALFLISLDRHNLKSHN